MRAFRHFGFALWLALALVAGQQAAAWHALGHVSDTLSQNDDPKPSPSKCGDCSACAQLSAAAAPTAPAVASVEGSHGAVVFIERGAHAALALAYRSRAPPTLL